MKLQHVPTAAQKSVKLCPPEIWLWKKLFLSFQHNAAIVQMNTPGEFSLFNMDTNICINNSFLLTEILLRNMKRNCVKKGMLITAVKFNKRT